MCLQTNVCMSDRVSHYQLAPTYTRFHLSSTTEKQSALRALAVNSAQQSNSDSVNEQAVLK